jgi:hypothetical protein
MSMQRRLVVAWSIAVVYNVLRLVFSESKVEPFVELTLLLISWPFSRTPDENHKETEPISRKLHRSESVCSPWDDPLVILYLSTSSTWFLQY